MRAAGLVTARSRNRGARPATEASVAGILDRPAFRKAHADQQAHFRAADPA